MLVSCDPPIYTGFQASIANLDVSVDERTSSLNGLLLDAISRQFELQREKEHAERRQQGYIKVLQVKEQQASEYSRTWRGTNAESLRL